MEKETIRIRKMMTPDEFVENFCKYEDLWKEVSGSPDSEELKKKMKQLDRWILHFDQARFMETYEEIRSELYPA